MEEYKLNEKIGSGSIHAIENSEFQAKIYTSPKIVALIGAKFTFNKMKEDLPEEEDELDFLLIPEEDITDHCYNHSSDP